jgi:hypothetical protein
MNLDPFLVLSGLVLPGVFALLGCCLLPSSQRLAWLRSCWPLLGIGVAHRAAAAEGGVEPESTARIKVKSGSVGNSQDRGVTDGPK